MCIVIHMVILCICAENAGISMLCVEGEPLVGITDREESQMVIRRQIPQPQAEPKPAVVVDIDKEAPKMTAEQYEEFAAIAEQKREERKKQVLTLRVSPTTMNKAKALGKGYTGILSRLLELALDDPDMVRKCL